MTLRKKYQTVVFLRMENRLINQMTFFIVLAIAPVSYDILLTSVIGEM